MRLLALAGLLAALVALPATAARSPQYQKAVRLFWQGKVEESIALYKKVLERDPGNAAVLTDLGFALARLGRAAEAEQQFRLAIQREPVRWNAYANLSDLLSAEESRWERRDEIPALLTEALLRQPPTARVPRVKLTMALARFERSVGRTREARSWLESLQDDDLTATERDSRLRLLDLLAADERARALEDWPEPAIDDGARQTLADAERLRVAGSFSESLRAVEPLLHALPTWRAPRWLRAQSLHSLGSMDEAARELSILVRLSPTHAEAWRLLGEILAAEGGLLEADRADEALRRALALEPAWVDLWRLRAKTALRRRQPADALRFLERLKLDPVAAREHAPELHTLLLQAKATLAQTGAPVALRPRPAEPSAETRELIRRAQELIARPDPDPSARAEGETRARELLLQALHESPASVEVAATLYSLTGVVPEVAVQAIWQDGPALLDLAAQVEKIGAAPRAVASLDGGAPPAEPGAAAASAQLSPAQLVQPWIERAVQLGAPEALWMRAELRARAGDRAGTLEDLVRYVSGSQPLHLDEARQLRASLTPPPRADPAQIQALLKLVEERPSDAQAELQLRCDRPPGKPTEQDAARLLALGRIEEFRGDLKAALACYRAAATAEPVPREALQRLSRVAARADATLLEPVLQQLEAASAAGLPSADWALARHLDSLGRADEALGRVEKFLGTAAPDDPARAKAGSVRDRILTARDAERKAHRRRLLLLSGAAVLLLLGSVLIFFHGTTVEGALRARPSLFPAVARAVAEVRHDVLKHRASVLSALADPALAQAARADVAHSFLSPEPTSHAVSAIYERLRIAARAQGLSLRRLGREPIFGPLCRDLARAEAWLADGAGRFDAAATDRRLREVHGDRLASLLKLGPRTRLDAPAISSWIRDVEVELRRTGGKWSSPALQLPGMEVEFPVERSALATIFVNLLRNAQAAAQQDGDRVLVRLGEERDAAGRRLVTLSVGDSSTHELTLEAIDTRESGRGLAIVRDLTREWHGHLVVRPESGPWRKSVGACFVAPSGPGARA